MAKAFRIEHLVKTYPGFQLGPLSLDLEPGIVLGYIGPNASGKTTTFHCLTRFVRIDGGRMEIFGRENDPDSAEWKFDIGYVGDKHVFFEGWTGDANLRFRGRFYPNWSHELARDLAGRFECPLDQKPKNMSSGNRVKLSIIAALAHSPRLLLLDEPTIGLDPVVRREVLDALFEVLADGERSIFYATHILTDIGRLADDLAFLVNGRIIQRSSKDDLLDMWRILKAELEYNRLNFAIFLMMVPVVFTYTAYRPSNIPLFIVWVMAFLAVNNWNAFRIKEKRDFQLVQLPLSVRQIAIARVLMVTIPPAGFVGLTALLQAAVVRFDVADLRILLTTYALVVLIFSLGHMFRDTFIGSRLLQQGKIALVIVLGLGVVANIYGLFVFKQAGDFGGRPPAFVRAVVYIIRNNPSTTPLRTAGFLAVSLALALLTVFTFERRTTYVE